MTQATNQEKDTATKQQMTQANVKFLNDQASAEAHEYTGWYEEIYGGAPPERELELFKTIQAWDRQNAGLIPLFWEKVYLLKKPTVEGFNPNPFMGGRFYFADVWLDSTAK